jgi:hypothetical protein
MTQDNDNEKDDRQKRFQRRRSHAQQNEPRNDAPRARRTTPYKRQRLDPSRYLEDEWDDDWFDDT